jgi:glycosyltransferase involved in cell wall biosynthesis
VQISQQRSHCRYERSEDRFTVIPPQPAGHTRRSSTFTTISVFTRGAVPLIEQADPDFIYQRYARFSWAGVVGANRTKRRCFSSTTARKFGWAALGSRRQPRFAGAYERLNLDAAARIFVVSEVERRNLEGAGVAAEKIVVNPNGVDVERFRPVLAAWRCGASCGFETMRCCGFVGTFGPWHGVEKLAERSS